MARLSIRRTLILIGLFVVAIPSAEAQIPTIEREALIALYNSTDEANWAANWNWRNADDTDFNDVGTECLWSGVTCDAGPNVVDIRLVGYNLVGTLPPELGDLASLESLDLFANHLSGEISPELGELQNLRILHLYDNELTGSIPQELGDLAALEQLHLMYNDLSGAIPPELARLSNLKFLLLYRNQLSGHIPSELGDLEQLEFLSLWGNHLDGPIPAQLSNLPNLEFLSLASNQLSGSVPAGFGDLAALTDLYLQSNQLIGAVPQRIVDLASLTSADFGYNALWTDDPTVQAFLDSVDPDWSDTQTIAPSGLSVAAVGDRTVWLEWTPIVYTEDNGGYNVFSEPVGAEVAVSGGSTQTKSDSTFPVTGLTPGQAYDFSARTSTRPHRDNPQNLVISDPTAPIMATTADTGCPAPQITVSGDYPFTLTASIHQTWEWSTGPTTQSIQVRPHCGSWYWVSTTDVGGCAEAAAVIVSGDLVFADDLESHELSFWSDVSP